jgi:UDP-glucose 4-epimerase
MTRVLVTGGAGFIGSHLVGAMIADGHDVVVLDDLSTGFREHVRNDVALIEGSIADLATVRQATEGVDFVLHHAAARAVARSVDDPIETDRVNTGGTLNVLVAGRDASVKRVIVASSSSVYGGVAPQPTPEEAELTPKSPYAVSKAAGELYARVFWELFEIETVRLRYFNVFGPRQRPDSPYAAVIPLFAQAILDGRQPEIHGDGLQSRDFTYIDDVVEANRRAIAAPGETVAGNVYNIAQGMSTTILDLWKALAGLSGTDLEPVFTSPRPGDVRTSRASVEAAERDLGFTPAISVAEGLDRVWSWMSSR